MATSSDTPRELIAVAVGGTGPFTEEAPLLTVEEYVESLGRRARVAGFLAIHRSTPRRTADAWARAWSEHMTRPVR